MNRFALAVVLITTMLCREAWTPAHAEIATNPVQITTCQPFPPSYPRGWELMVRRPCLIYYRYAPYYEAPTHYRLAATYPYRPALHVRYPIHRRPYLRPGWWW